MALPVWTEPALGNSWGSPLGLWKQAQKVVPNVAFLANKVRTRIGTSGTCQAIFSPKKQKTGFFDTNIF